MASVATTNISNVNFADSKISISGYAIEIWRIAAGQLSGDTAVITPLREKLICAVPSGQVNDLASTGASSVTITLGTFSTAVTSTIGQVDVMIMTRPR